MPIKHGDVPVHYVKNDRRVYHGISHFIPIVASYIPIKPIKIPSNPYDFAKHQSIQAVIVRLDLRQDILGSWNHQAHPTSSH